MENDWRWREGGKDLGEPETVTLAGDLEMELDVPVATSWVGWTYQWRARARWWSTMGLRENALGKRMG
jgi:hypothetical protein